MNVSLRKLEVIAPMHKQGVATRVVALIAASAAARGFATIEVDALMNAASDGSAANNGAYTFARLGFDRRLPEDVVSTLPSYIKERRTTIDLMQDAAGVAFWKEAARSGRMVFELLSDSRSWAVLRSYLKEKKIRIIK